MSDVVDLSVPVRADLLVLARFTAATVASRADFGIEDVEDLRLVTEELCLSVIGTATDGTIHLRFIRDDGAVTVECSLDRNGTLAVASSDFDDLSLRIIEALVDEYGVDPDGGRSWIRKSRTKATL